jgi:hypothetical protein
MRRDVDTIRNYLFGGGYPDPVSNAEQLAFLFFFYLVEGIDAENQARAKVLKQQYTSMFDGFWTLKNPLNAPSKGEITIPKDRFRWSVWATGLSGEPLVRFLRDEVFPFFTDVAGGSAVNFMHGARLVIDEPTVLTQVVTLVDGLRLDRSDADTKGDLFEHVLRQIKQAGELGQFRTPRHIIRTIVEIVDPKVGETVYDPAAGTAGFLVAAYNHMRLANSAPGAIQHVDFDGKTQTRGLGDKLSSAQLSAIQNNTFFIDSSRGRIFLHFNYAWVSPATCGVNQTQDAICVQNGYDDGQIQHVYCTTPSDTTPCGTRADPDNAPRATLYSNTTVSLTIGDDGFIRDLFIYMPKGTLTLAEDPANAVNASAPNYRGPLWIDNLSMGSGLNDGNQTQIAAPAFSSTFQGLGTPTVDNPLRLLPFFEWIVRGSSLRSLYGAS